MHAKQAHNSSPRHCNYTFLTQVFIVVRYMRQLIGFMKKKER